MKITAAAISQKQFMIRPMGLDAEEVYAFLEVIKEDMYELDKEKAVLYYVNRSQSTQIKLTDAILSATINNLKKIVVDMTPVKREKIINEMLALLLPFQQGSESAIWKDKA